MAFWDSVRRDWDQNLPTKELSRRKPAAFKRSWNPFTGKACAVAVMGTPGAGKTLLYDALARKIRNGYQPAGASYRHEPHRVIVRHEHGRERVQFVIVPGQASEERDRWLEYMFEDGQRPIGVVYAAPWGFNTIWSQGEQATIASQLQRNGGDLNLEAIRNVHLRNESRDFAQICELLKECWTRDSAQRYWMIVAVTKIDLYLHRLGEARDYYVPADEANEQSAFCVALRSLVNWVGEARFARVAVVPVSAFPEPYKFQTRFRIDSNLDRHAATESCANLGRMIGELV